MGRAEGGRAKADDQGLLRNLMAELWRLLAKLLEVNLEVLRVSVKLIDAFEVVVDANDVKRLAVAVQILARELEALGGASEKGPRASAVLGLSKVSK